MPLIAVKMCCHFKNSEYLQKILEQFSVFDSSHEHYKATLSSEEIEKFEIKQITNYDYMEGKKKIEFVDYRTVLEQFEGYTPLHIAIMSNSFDCVKLLLEETNADVTEKSAKGETTVILACKYGVSIEILESLLVSLRTMMTIEEVKAFLDLEDNS